MKFDQPIVLTDSLSFKVKFRTSRSLSSFLKKEIEFWEKQTENLGGSENVTAIRQTSHLNQIADVIAKASEEKSTDLDNRQQQILTQSLNALKANWIVSTDPVAITLLDLLNAHGPNTANAFVEYVKNETTTQIGDKDRFKGILAGYEIKNQDSDILRRRRGEEAALEELRERYHEAFVELQDEATIQESNAEQLRREKRNKLDQLLRVGSKLNDRRNRKIVSEFDQQMNDWREAIENLETTYDHLLRLKQPAKYWADRAVTLRWQAGLWLLALVAVVALLGFYLHEFFVLWLLGTPRPLTLNTLQGAIIFAALLSAFAYLIRVLSRLVFSSLHLQRDAEERNMLTYVFLSMINETNLHDDAFPLVLQALFSRSDTGLLGGESAPTMPTISELKRVIK